MNNRDLFVEDTRGYHGEPVVEVEEQELPEIVEEAIEEEQETEEVEQEETNEREELAYGEE